jgi:hypothetical protein
MYEGFMKWKPFLKKEMIDLNPDIVLVDFMTIPGL